MTCYHTFVRWVNKIATCAVCGEVFSYKHDPRLIGTFPREILDAREVLTVNTTSIIAPIKLMEDL